jgi:hypothetical protein
VKLLVEPYITQKDRLPRNRQYRRYFRIRAATAPIQRRQVGFTRT